MDKNEQEQSEVKVENCGISAGCSVKSGENMDGANHDEGRQRRSSQTEDGDLSSRDVSEESSEISKNCDINATSTDVVMVAGTVGSPISEADEVMEVSDGKDSSCLEQGDAGRIGEVTAQHIKCSDPPVSDSASNYQPQQSTKEPAYYYPCPLPQVNCPEKIIICIDLASEMNRLPFKLGNGSKFPPISMVKRVTEIFIQNKSRINKKHEYALVTLHEKATWVKGFSSDPNDVCYALDNFNNTKLCSDCDLSSLFKLVSEKVEFLDGSSQLNPPQFVVRVILIYGRSNCVPKFNDETTTLKILKKTGCFFFDVLYIHEPPSPDNKCQEVFESFCDVDENLSSYLFEVTRNTTKLHNCMAKLLSHPLQRPIQKDAVYKL